MPDKTASRFDSEAATWDSNPTTVRSSALFFEAIQSRFPQLAQGGEKNKRALEIGCGTGLLSVHLAPLLDEYLCFDPSQVSKGARARGMYRCSCLSLCTTEAVFCSYRV